MGQQYITEDIFFTATGRAPENDDLERVNCQKAGEPGHFSCGWCPVCGGPNFECPCAIKTAVESDSESV